MLKLEKNYEFRKRMLDVHQKDIWDKTLIKQDDEFQICDEFRIYFPENSGEVVLTAAKDFSDYLFTSMNIPSMLLKREYDGVANSVVISLAYENEIDLEDAEGYRGYRIDVKDDTISTVFGKKKNTN